MYSLSVWFRSKSNSEPLRWNIRWIFFSKIAHGYSPSTIFVKNHILDVPLSLNTTLQIRSHY